MIFHSRKFHIEGEKKREKEKRKFLIKKHIFHTKESFLENFPRRLRAKKGRRREEEEKKNVN